MSTEMTSIDEQNQQANVENNQQDNLVENPVENTNVGEGLPTQNEEKSIVEEGSQESQQKELSQEEQVRLGKVIKAERARMKAQFNAEYERKLEAYRQQQAAQLNDSQSASNNINQIQGKVYDPETAEYIDANSPIGQILIRNQKIAQRKEQSKLANEYDYLRNKASEGFTRFDNYEECHINFVNLGTDVMAEALKGVDDPAAVINYLGAHTEEIKRISQLPPARQQREIYRMDLKLNPPKKLVSGAKEPINPVNEKNNPAARAEHQTYEQRASYWAKQINQR